MEIIPAWLASCPFSKPKGKTERFFSPCSIYKIPSKDSDWPAYFGSHAHPWANHDGQEKGHEVLRDPI